MAVSYYKQYRDKHKPKIRLTDGKPGRSRGVGINACDGCHYLQICRVRVKEMNYWPPCFVCSAAHRYYRARYGKRSEEAQA